ncbi:MAG: hypothetical protein U9R75_03970, partial [Candidatus Thermoplasmatota archaeon]|nr:hypothetical protein [Candidatus Thermoplasmatota archaeon]
MELVFIRSSVAVSIIVISLTLLILGSVTYQTIARPGTRGASSNCNSCHSSSYYLTVDIRSVDAPSSLLKGSSGWINVTVDVSASHESSLWSGFSMDVWLSSSGKIDTGSHQILTGLSPSGSSPPYSWSDTFEFQVSAISAGMDTVTAYAKMDPVHYSPPVTDSQKVQVEIPNNSPILDSGLVTPVSGYSDGTFSFSVNYLDLDGDLPSSINVFIDSILYAMSDLPGGDGSVKDGELFGVSGIYLDEGSHSFHFEASDGIEQTRFPASGEQNGPEVLHRNLPPELDVGRVSPSVGTPGDIFTFTVIYTDPEDDAPDPGVLVSIDGENNWTLMERDAEETGHLGDGSFDNGETFSVSIPLGVGRHIYRFNCSDGELTSTLGPIYGPDVDETAIIVSVIEEPENGSTHLSNGSIRLSGSFSSNVEVQDAEALWRSNISGVIGSGWSFNTRLEYGSHRLFFKVTSALEGMSHESHVDILVKDPVVAPEVDLVRESSPEGDVVIEETENVTFSISLDPDHPMILEDANLVVTWYLDDLVR